MQIIQKGMQGCRVEREGMKVDFGEMGGGIILETEDGRNG